MQIAAAARDVHGPFPAMSNRLWCFGVRAGRRSSPNLSPLLPFFPGAPEPSELLSKNRPMRGGLRSIVLHVPLWTAVFLALALAGGSFCLGVEAAQGTWNAARTVPSR